MHKIPMLLGLLTVIAFSFALYTIAHHEAPSPPAVTEVCGVIVFRNLIQQGETNPMPVCVRTGVNGSMFIYNPDASLDAHIRIYIGESAERLTPEFIVPIQPSGGSGDI